MGRVFAIGPGDLGSILKNLKIALDTSLLNTHEYKVRIMGKVGNPGKVESPSPTPQCSSY